MSMSEVQAARYGLQTFSGIEAKPFRIGVCMDWNAVGTPFVDDFYKAMRLACDEGFDAGRIVRPVEFIHREVKGPMAGLNSTVLDAWKELAYEENVLAVIGPVVTEANLAIRDEVNRGEVPTISFCATLDWAGEYCYALPNGAFVDEAHLLAAYVRRAGWRQVGVLHEDGTIGEEFFAAFRRAARLYGLDIVSDHVVGLFNTMKPIAPQLEAIKASGAECLVGLSGYGASQHMIQAVRDLRDRGEWHLPCLKNLYPAEGWIALHQVHPENKVYASVLDRYEAAHGDRPGHAYVALGYDHGQVLVEALSTMKPPSPKGFKHALDHVRMVDAAIGAPGTKISFGLYDHRGYKGDYIVFATVTDGIEEVIDVSWADLLRMPVETMTPPPMIPGLMPDRDPFRIGVCQDYAAGTGDKVEAFWNGSRLAFAEAYELGLIDRPVELVIEEFQSSLYSPYEAVEGLRRLVLDEKCIGIIGPHWTDVCLVAQEEVERLKVPAISHCATINWRGEYCFTAPNGTFLDETNLIARHLVRRGVRTVGVVHEDNPIGDEYFDFFRRHARRLGLAIAADATVPGMGATVEECADALDAIRRSGAESVAHMGLGRAFAPLTEAMVPLVADGWDVPRVSITIWVTLSGVTHSPTPWNKDRDLVPLEGWVGIDLPHEGNGRFNTFLDNYEKRFGQRIFNCYPAHMYDMAWMLALGLAYARPVTPEGLKRGLEQVRMFPSTMGSPGTVLGFGPYDHRGYKGADYLVLRTLQKGVEGLVEDFGLV